jgi:hypothetical protein
MIVPGSQIQAEPLFTSPGSRLYFSSLFTSLFVILFIHDLTGTATPPRTRRNDLNWFLGLECRTQHSAHEHKYHGYDNDSENESH